MEVIASFTGCNLKVLLKHFVLYLLLRDQPVLQKFMPSSMKENLKQWLPEDNILRLRFDGMVKAKND